MIEEYGILRCNAVYFGDCATFRRNTSPVSSGPKIKPNIKPAESDG
jgi:hypothetical protein